MTVDRLVDLGEPAKRVDHGEAVTVAEDYCRAGSHGGIRINLKEM